MGISFNSNEVGAGVNGHNTAPMADATVDATVVEPNVEPAVELAVRISGFNAYYGKNHALKNINLDIPCNKIYAFIGPSGCGKTTLLRSINRLNDLIPSFRQEGAIEVGGDDVYAYRSKKAVENLRMGIGMVFQQPNPLPMTIMQNMLLPVKEHYREKHSAMVDLAIRHLKNTGLYDEVKDRLSKTAMKLSGGQQQRLCIARALMLNPKIVLFDEPCSALDPISTSMIEELLLKLKESYTVIMVTHNMEQAKRIADYTAFFFQGEVVEKNTTHNLFASPEMEMTRHYVMGLIPSGRDPESDSTMPGSKNPVGGEGGGCGQACERYGEPQ